MSEVMRKFYTIRYSQGKCTEETLNALVLSGKLTQGECDEIINEGETNNQSHF